MPGLRPQHHRRKGNANRPTDPGTPADNRRAGTEEVKKGGDSETTKRTGPNSHSSPSSGPLLWAKSPASCRTPACRPPLGPVPQLSAEGRADSGAPWMVTGGSSLGACGSASGALPSWPVAILTGARGPSCSSQPLATAGLQCCLFHSHLERVRFGSCCRAHPLPSRRAPPASSFLIICFVTCVIGVPGALWSLALAE